MTPEIKSETRLQEAIHYAEIPYGFEYGAAKVTRLFSDEKKGWVVIGIDTAKEALQIYVTKT